MKIISEERIKEIVRKLLFEYKYKGYVLYFNEMHHRWNLSDKVSLKDIRDIEVFMYQRKKNVYSDGNFVINMKYGGHHDEEIFITEVAPVDTIKKYQQEVMVSDLDRFVKLKLINVPKVHTIFYGDNCTAASRSSDRHIEDFQYIIDYFEKYLEQHTTPGNIMKMGKLTIGNYSIDYNSHIFNDDISYKITVTLLKEAVK